MATTRMRLLAAWLAAAGLWAVGTAPAGAHPHVFITVEATVMHERGAFVGIEHKWTFDELYTSMAIEGLDKNKDGVYDREELAELAKVNIEGLKEFAYFTYPLLAGQELKVGEVTDYWLEHKDGILSLHFKLPFSQPVLEEAKGLTFSIQDPTFFIAFELAKTNPIRFAEGTPKHCRIKMGKPGKEPAAASALGEAPSAQAPAFAMTSSQAIAVDCSAP